MDTREYDVVTTEIPLALTDRNGNDEIVSYMRMIYNDATDEHFVEFTLGDDPPKYLPVPGDFVAFITMAQSMLSSSFAKAMNGRFDADEFTKMIGPPDAD